MKHESNLALVESLFYKSNVKKISNMLSSDSKCGSQQFWSSPSGHPSLAKECEQEPGEAGQGRTKPTLNTWLPWAKSRPLSQTCQKKSKQHRGAVQRAATLVSRRPPCGQAVLLGGDLRGQLGHVLAAPLPVCSWSGVQAETVLRDLEAGEGCSLQISTLRGPHVWRSLLGTAAPPAVPPPWRPRDSPSPVCLWDLTQCPASPGRSIKAGCAEKNVGEGPVLPQGTWPVSTRSPPLPRPVIYPAPTAKLSLQTKPDVYIPLSLSCLSFPLLPVSPDPDMTTVKPTAPSLHVVCCASYSAVTCGFHSTP